MPKKVLSVTFSDAETGIVDTVSVSMALDRPATDLLWAAAKAIDAQGKSDFAGSLAKQRVEFDATQGKTRVIVFNNDRGTMPVTVLIVEGQQWDWE